MKTKYFSRTWLLAIAALLLPSFVSCSDDISIFDPDNVVINDEITSASVNMVSKSWGSAPEQVKGEQKEGLEIREEDTDLLRYSNKSDDFDISYEFLDGKLRASLLLLPTTEPAETSNYQISGYKFLGNIESAPIYLSSDSKNYATIISRKINGNNYLAIGFTPVESDLYEAVTPIEVITLPATEITANSMYLSGRTTGITSAASASFVYSTNADLSDAKTKSATISSDGTFRLSLTNLRSNITIYYKAVISEEGILYEGEVLSAELKKQKTYEIGDLYPDTYTPQGVVCRVTNDGTHGTIVSLDEKYLKWDNNGIFCTDYGCNSLTNGSKNDMGSTNPYAKWVKDHGMGWYGPARGQLMFTKSDLRKINAGLTSAGGTELDGFYYSSTEHSSNTVWVVTVTEVGYLGYSNQYYFYVNKDNSETGRAMKDF